MKAIKKLLGSVVKFFGILFLIIIVLCLWRCSAVRKENTDDGERNEVTQEDNSSSDVTNNMDMADSSEIATDNEAEADSENVADDGNAENQEENNNEAASSNSSGMRPEFKEAMDSYEAFYDEYCAFMKKYNANPSDMSLLAEYGDMMSELAEMNEKFKEWEGNDLNTEELKYYVEVNNRVTQKLLAVTQ